MGRNRILSKEKLLLQLRKRSPQRIWRALFDLLENLSDRVEFPSEKRNKLFSILFSRISQLDFYGRRELPYTPMYLLQNYFLFERFFEFDFFEFRRFLDEFFDMFELSESNSSLNEVTLLFTDLLLLIESLSKDADLTSVFNRQMDNFLKILRIEEVWTFDFQQENSSRDYRNGLRLLPDISQSDIDRLILDYPAFRDFIETTDERIFESPINPLIKSMYWTIRTSISLQVVKNQIMRAVSGFVDFSIGFLNLESNKNTFGVVVHRYAVDQEDSNFEIPQSLQVGELNVPIIVRSITIQRHGLLHPLDGTATAWATSRITGRKKEGILTCKHVLQTKSIGQTIHFEDARKGKVLDIGPDGIDAAIIKCPDSRPANLSQVNVSKFITPGASAYFNGSFSVNPIKTTVLRVNDLTQIIDSPHLPLRIYLADAGIHGDSGALVFQESISSMTSDVGIGIYVAAVYSDPQRNAPEGLAQHLAQVVAIMDMEVFV